MAITEADIRLMQSQRLTDFPDGGGRMTSVAIVDGVENNLFPDVGTLDRVFGRQQYRKVFGAVLSEDADTFIGAHLIVDDAPDDPAVTGCVFAYGGLTTERQEAAAAFTAAAAARNAFTLYTKTTPTFGNPPLVVAVIDGEYTWTGGGTTLSVDVVLGGGSTSVLIFGPESVSYGLIPAGTALEVYVDGVLHYVTTTADRVAGTQSGPSNGGSTTATLTFTTTALPGSGAKTGRVTALHPAQPSGGARPFGVTFSPGGISEGATSLTVDSVYVRYVPNDAGIKTAIIRAGDAVLVHSTVAMTPATVSNGQTVNTTRINLSRLRVIGSAGVVHATFTENSPAPSGVGCTADLAAGTVTFSDVSGMAQPVTVEHRIEDAVVVSAVTAPSGLTLSTPVGRAFPAGSKVSSILVIGDLQGRAQDGFAQQAWTGVWSNTRIGAEILPDFNHSIYPISTTNAGAVTERWAIIFTNTTAFRVIGEFVGEIGTGATGTAFAPTNPATGAPYFTIPAAGWGSGWAAGNVYRFNTVGAQAPLWALRCIAPSEPFGSDSMTLQLRGDIDA